MINDNGVEDSGVSSNNNNSKNQQNNKRKLLPSSFHPDILSVIIISIAVIAIGTFLFALYKEYTYCGPSSLSLIPQSSIPTPAPDSFQQSFNQSYIDKQAKCQENSLLSFIKN